MDTTEDERLAEQLHEHDRDDAPPCRHACCERLRHAVLSVQYDTRHVMREPQDWMLEGGGQW